MPITFEQPQPVAPAISSAYGAAGVMQQNNPLLLQQQQMRQSAYEHAAQLSAQQAMQQAELGQRAAQHRDEMAFRQQALAADQDVSARDAFHAQAAMAAQAQAADLHAYYASQEMTQHEAILLQRKRQALAEVMNNPTLDDETRQNMALQIKTDIDPLAQKERMTQMKAQQARAAQIQQETAHAASMEAENAKFHATTLESRMRPVTLPDGTVATVIDNGPGKNPTVIPGGKGVSKEEKQFELDTKHYETAHAAWLRHHNQYEGLVAQRVKALRETPAGFDKSEEELRAMAEKGIGMPKPGPGPVAPARPGTTKPGQPEGVASEKDAGTAGSGQAAAGGERPAGAKPFAEDKPDTWNLHQREVMTGFYTDRDRILKRADLPPAVRQQFIELADKAKDIMLKAGGPQGLTPHERDELVAIQQQLRSLPPPPQEAPAAPARPPFLRRQADALLDQIGGIPAAVRSASPFGR